MPLLDLFWTMLMIFLWVLWLWLLIMVITDIFRSDDLTGWGKAGWAIFTLVLPYLGVFVYLIARGRSMGERRLREQQDRSGGFVTFVPLAYQEAATRLVPRQTPPADSLRTIAIARLILDNFPHVEAYWVTLGEETASVALHFGADDVNGTLEDEKIQHLSGATTPAGVAREQLFRMIRDAGKIPVERDALYNVVKIWN